MVFEMNLQLFGGRGGSSGMAGGGDGGFGSVEFALGEYGKEKESFIIEQFKKLMRDYPLGDESVLQRVVGTREKFGLPKDMEDYDVEDALYARGIDEERYRSDAYYDGRGELIVNDGGLNKGTSLADSVKKMRELIDRDGPGPSISPSMAGFGGEYEAAHEYGHILARSYDMYGGQKGARELVNYWQTHKDSIAKDLGGYSRMNWNEAFAEAFAQSRYKPLQSKSAKDMMDIFARQVKNYKK